MNELLLKKKTINNIEIEQWYSHNSYMNNISSVICWGISYQFVIKMKWETEWLIVECSDRKGYGNRISNTVFL